MALITIDGVEMPQPVKYSFPMSDVCGDDIYNENGELFRDCIRTGVFSIDLQWTVEAQQAQLLLNAAENPTVSVTYFDPRTNKYEHSEQMYVSDRSCELIKYDSSNEASSLWSIGFSLCQY